MTYIDLHLPDDESIFTGKQVTFKAPCDCSSPEALKIGQTVFTVVDAAGNNVLGTDGTFVKDAIVTVVLDCENSKAYIQNAASRGVTHSNQAILDATTASYTVAEKTKLSGVEAGANKYTHPSYASKKGVPTANQTPVFGGTFSVTQPVCDSLGHVTELNTRTVTIPNTVATTSNVGLMSATDKTILNTLNSELPVLKKSVADGKQLLSDAISGYHEENFPESMTDDVTQLPFQTFADCIDEAIEFQRNDAYWGGRFAGIEHVTNEIAQSLYDYGGTFDRVGDMFDEATPDDDFYTLTDEIVQAAFPHLEIFEFTVPDYTETAANIPAAAVNTLLSCPTKLAMLYTALITDRTASGYPVHVRGDMCALSVNSITQLTAYANVESERAYEVWVGFENKELSATNYTNYPLKITLVFMGTSGGYNGSSLIPKGSGDTSTQVDLNKDGTLA